MNTQIGKRLLNLLLVGCLCASLLLGTALATDAEGTTEPDGYINSIDVDAVDEAVDDVETITGEEAYTAPVSYADDVESGTCGKNLTWVLEDGVLTISGTGEMVSNAYYIGYSPWYGYGLLDSIVSVVIEDGVSNIVDFAFQECSNLTSILIPYSVTSIGRYAFYGCSSLTEISIPDSITEIGERAFCECSRLQYITLPDSIANIGARAFMNCSSLTDVTLSKNLTSLEEAIFYGCINLAGIEIPSGVTKIGYSAFYGCSSLSSITIPNGVTDIGMYAFYECSNLTGVSLPNSLSSIENYLFYGCGSLTDITVPNNITKIGSYAFYGCSSLMNIAFPDSVTDIGDYTFYGCSSMADISLPNGITAIGSYAFHGCSGLTDIVLPDNMTTIADYAFYKCTGLTNIIFPNDVTSIGSHSFCGCTGLTRITIPDGVTNIGASAFEGCSNLLSAVLPSSVSSIGNSAFRGCNDLINVYYSGSEEDWNAIEIGNYNTCLTSATIHYNSSGANNVISGTCGDDLTWTLEDRLLTISGTGNMTDVNMEESPWYSYRTEITEVVVETGVTGIGLYAFYNCSNLATVTLPDSMTSIGELAFYECASLTDIVIPSGVTEISFGVFENCKSLESIVVPQSATSIGEAAFTNCTSLSNIVIPDSVMTIGVGAFYNCPALSSVTLPPNITYIDNSVFYGCSSLTSITIPDGVTALGNYAFAECGLLSSITIPDSVVSVGAYAFYECSALSDVYYDGYVATLLAVEIGSHNTALTDATFYDADGDICDVLPIVTLWKLESTASGVALEWYGLSAADGYRIYRKTAYESYELIATVGSGTTNYTDVTTENSETYYYYVQAYSGTALSFYTQKYIAYAYRFNTVTEADELIAEATNNTGSQNYGIYGAVVNSYLTETDDGFLLRVEYANEQIVAEYYNSDYELTKKYNIPVELSVFGGFYAGEDAYYLVFGQPNPDDDDNVEVIRVVKYSKDWERLTEASLCGANTYIPFDAGSLRMTETNDCLYLHTCHEMYASTDGLHHQANMEITVTEDSMTISANYGVSDYYTYVSHSFNQFVIVDDDGHKVVLDQGDGAPRGVALNGTNIFSFEGSDGYNPTGASLGGLEYSSTSYLVAGNSVTQDSNWYSHTARNIFLIVKDRETSEISVNWITDYDTDGEISASTPQLVKLDSDSFLLMWTTTEYLDNTISGSQQTKLHYVYLDDAGTAVSEIYTVTGQLSDCKPIVYNGAVHWYVTGDADGSYSTSDSAPCFCTISADGIYSTGLETPKFTAEFAADGILVNWNATDNADGYYVYLAQPDGIQGWNVADGTTTSATVAPRYSGQNCVIWVSAWSNSGTRSLAENKTMFWYLAAPSVTLDYSESGVSLNWDAVSGAENYRVYRKTENGTYSLLGATEDVSWTDAEIVAGYTYTYQVFSCAGDYTSAGSAEESICTYSSINAYSDDFALLCSITDGAVSIVGYTGNAADVDLVIPNTIAGCPVTEIADSAFYRCKALISVVLPDSVDCIGRLAFSQCENLTDIVLGSGLTIIEESAFASCWDLTDVVLPEGLLSIGKKAFWNCFMSSVAIPISVTQIGEGAFQYCYQLTDVYYGGSETDWNAIEVENENEYLTSATIHYTTTGADDEPTAAATPGDLNGDGEVNASDLTILARHIGKVEYITDKTALANADVTGNGNVDASDLTKLAQYVGKIISSLD